jgi:integrase/recombinase XerD
MEQFKKYLEAKKYHPSTVKQTIVKLNKFFEWLQMQYSWTLEEIVNMEYKHVLDYVSHEQQRKISNSTIRNQLGIISRYFDFLNIENNIKTNPARAIQLKGAAKTITENPLKYEELEKLYQGYATLIKNPIAASINTPKHLQERSALAHERNGIAVGLLIYQALTSGELEKINVEDVNLTDGTIYIASSGKSNSRTLQLNTQQILPLYSYLHGGTRDKLLSLPMVGLTCGHREKDQFKNSLLVGKTYAVVKQIIQELRGINPQLKNAQHIRASVILYWLKLHNKRQVQYMAGHKYIDSTEKYAIQEMDSLTDALTKYHPFG